MKSEVEEMYTKLPDPYTCVVTLEATAQADVIALRARLSALLDGSAVEVVVCEVGAITADIAAVHALATLALMVRRRGCHLCLRHVSAELEALLALCGLEAVLSS